MKIAVVLLCAGLLSCESASQRQSKAEAERDESAEIDARLAVARLMRDPDTAKFEGVIVVRDASDERAVCGSVNGANAMGGMDGARRFAVKSGHAEIEGDRDFEAFWGLVCRRA